MHVTNSLPIILVGFLLCFYKKWKAGMLLFASMILHVLLDFPVHTDDAHAHLWPLSDWKFDSGISYWNSSQGGNIVGVIESVIAIVL